MKKRKIGKRTLIAAFMVVIMMASVIPTFAAPKTPSGKVTVQSSMKRPAKKATRTKATDVVRWKTVKGATKYKVYRRNVTLITGTSRVMETKGKSISWKVVTTTKSNYIKTTRNIPVYERVPFDGGTGYIQYSVIPVLKKGQGKRICSGLVGGTVRYVKKSKKK